MKVSDFDFQLPQELLAEYPSDKRDASKLMVINRQKATIEHHHFYDIPTFFEKGDLLIRNSTKVKAARYQARKEHLNGARLEILLINNIDGRTWEAFIDPLVKVKVGSTLLFGADDLKARIINIIEQRSVLIEFFYPEDLNDLNRLLKQKGEMPIPRYIKRKPEEVDFERYQTVYADEETALAAPTSGLHFTKELFNEIENRGVEIADLNLEIGLGTFNPVYVDEIRDHNMHSEEYSISQNLAAKVNQWKEKNKRVVALGTTSVRATESTFSNGKLLSGKFSTDIFIYPPYKFKVADVLITNFHTPRSTLLMLVCAFGGYELIMKAYQEAIDKNYRFYSYGDSMMIV